MHIPEAKCKCFIPPFYFKDYTETYLGQDNTHGRYADVTLCTCIHCGTKWLHYLVEYEAFSQSGRWYKGIITDKELPQIDPENAVVYLENLEWYIYGGSWFSCAGQYGKGKMQVDM
ncbi:hypothetical protein QNI19_07355 [Cytophagaceae bacterium DM2B3-1]|uniref:CENP-V/GFA domain-containing protein n=2 Tax=Xanthocytophaga TaxID=3078918 RepID=A0ABT7CGC9_9BACT|nr:MULTISPECIES: hypothetical protein [Xanthocytophaga]MDJ1492743.1 hypothetical protein [Xanthocytophaga flavus]MDJ1500957.1 hypothetical protein [Xanthocytophaga agilis]